MGLLQGMTSLGSGEYPGWGCSRVRHHRLQVSTQGGDVPGYDVTGLRAVPRVGLYQGMTSQGLRSLPRVGLFQGMASQASGQCLSICSPHRCLSVTMVTVCRMISWVWFCYAIFFTLKHYPEKSSFYYPFFIFYTIW